MSLQARVLTLSAENPAERDEILAFESALRSVNPPDELAQALALWQARYRPEALEFYLPLGWSFAIRDEDEVMQGYFLAQPILFWAGMTQTLWIEHLAYSRLEVCDELLDLAVRWGRDKHLQRVLFSQNLDIPKGLDRLKIKHEIFNEKLLSVKTTKLS